MQAWAVLEEIEAERVPAPQPVAPVVDEFDEIADTDPESGHAGTVMHPGTAEDPAAPVADGAHTQEFFLAKTDQDAVEMDHHGSGFADALQRYGVDIEGLPAGYLPAADFFSEREEVDVHAHRARKRKRGLLTGLVIALVVAVVGAAGWYGLSRLTAPPPDYAGPGSGKVEFTISEGQGTRQIGKALESQGVVKSAAAFNAAVSDADPQPVFQPGDFQLRSKMKASRAMEELSASSDKVTYFAVTANARMNDTLEVIADETDLDIDELKALARTPEHFGLPKSIGTLEGYLHPGEYRFPVDATAEDVLRKLVGETVSSLKKQGITDHEEQYRVLKVGSVVAGEGTPSDYPHIAGIIENRLKPNDETHGYLQLDSTVSYGLGQVSIHLTKKQLQDKSNPYNSYKHKGLPPGPIGSPGNKAIAAAASPQPSKDFYWVTVNLKTGETKFAKNLKQHEKYVKQYRSWCSDNEDYCK